MAVEYANSPESLSKKDIQCLEYTYLTVARGIRIARERFGLQPDQTMQILAPGAGEYIFADIASDVQIQSQKSGIYLPMKLVRKPISRDTFVSAFSERSDGKSPARLLTDLMLKDNRQGQFIPDLPTLWIDSALMYSFVVYLGSKPLSTVPIGNPAIYMSTNFTSKPHSWRFMDLYGAVEIFGTDNSDFTGAGVEKAFRFPVKKSEIDSDGMATIEYSAERAEKSKYYAGLAWIESPKYQERRTELWQASQNQESARAELDNILATV